jgi:biopolymer transport protein ExbD
MGRNIVHVVWLAASICAAPLAHAADAPPMEGTVTLSVNRDGSIIWNGERLPNQQALEARLANRTQRSPSLQLDIRFHSVGSLGDSNRQTLLDLVELTARFGYVHVESVTNGARLTVLGPTAGEDAPAK